MAVEKGSAFLLKVGDGTATPAYATVAGLRTTQLSINGEAVVVTNKASGGWRELLSGAGVRSVSVAAAGVFTGSGAETRIKGSALTGVIDDYELSFESGERMGEAVAEAGLAAAAPVVGTLIGQILRGR
jgi:TP901-1 family phage major tail protein